MSTAFGQLRGEGKRGSRKKLIEAAAWTDEYAPTCEGCQKIYAARNPPEEPPCLTCRVDLLPENEDAARIYRMVRGQVILRHNGRYDTIMDLNHLALWAAIDGYRIKDRIGCFEKVLTVFHYFQNEGQGDES